jgi:hypothetical protein
LIKLSVPNVNGIDMGGAALQQTIGESAGGCASINGATTVDPDIENRKRSVEFVPATTDKARGRAEQPYWLSGAHQPGCFFGH